jgi:hypothetical protein
MPAGPRFYPHRRRGKRGTSCCAPFPGCPGSSQPCSRRFASCRRTATVATEAAYGVVLLLFWPAAFQVLRSVPATLGLPVLLFISKPSGCPFFRLAAYFQDEVSFRLRCTFPEGYGAGFRSLLAEAIYFLRPCDSIVERTFPVFFDLPNIRDWSGTRFPLFSLRLS